MHVIIAPTGSVRYCVGVHPTSYDLDRPWIRQPCDTDTRWRAFVAYRDQALPRTIRAVSEALTSKGKPFDVRTLERYSSADGWPERAAAFDRMLDEERVAVIVDVLAEDARETASRHVELLRDAQDAAAVVVRQWLDDVADGKRLDGWSPGEVRGMIKDMVTLERLVRGEATERVEHGVGFDLALLTLDEIDTMRRLEAKAGVVG